MVYAAEGAYDNRPTRLEAHYRAQLDGAVEVGRRTWVVAGAEEGLKWLMPRLDKNAINRERYAEARCRTAVLKRARELARSGEYANSKGIITELTGMKGFESALAWLKDTELRAQLDHLCVMARVQRTRKAPKCEHNHHDSSAS